jgi:hypothetical protein
MEVLVATKITLPEPKLLSQRAITTRKGRSGAISHECEACRKVSSLEESTSVETADDLVETSEGR